MQSLKKLQEKIKILWNQQNPYQQNQQSISLRNKGMVIAEQKYAKMIGLNGCYFTCLLYLAELITHNNYDIIDEFYYCTKQEEQGIKWITEECYVNYPDKILSHYINKKVTIKKEFNLDYKAKKNELLVGCYIWNNQSHFVVVDNKFNVIFDPLGESNTVKNGYLQSLRILTIYE